MPIKSILSKKKNYLQTNFVSTKQFISRQFRQINSGGFAVIYRKLLILLKLILISIPALIIVILIRLISPLILIKLGALDFGRLGQIYLCKWYLKLKKIEEIKSRRLIHLFFIHNSTSYINAQWLKMWCQSLNILPFSSLWQKVLIINNLFPGSEKYQISKYIGLQNPCLAKQNKKFINSLKKESLDKITKIKLPVIYFKNEEIQIGRNYLKKIGTSEYSFICFHARDSAYLNKHGSDYDWSYHDFRNSDIYNYLPAVKEMLNKNFVCIRMGSVVESKLNNINSKLIDYANSKDRTDLLDIYLGSRCYFSIYGESGITAIPETFDRPIVYLNWPGINNAMTFANNSLFIPRKFFSATKKRFLTYKEIIELNFVEKHYSSKGLEELNIKLIENTPQEITEVVTEMYSRLNGTWKSDNDDESLQEKFWSLFDCNFVKSPTFRIGSSFLKKNHQFLL